MALKRAGFFRESRSDHSLPSIHEFVHDVAQDDEGRTATYLRSGVLHIASPGPAFDVLSSTREVAGAQHLLTDGVWVWPADYAYYVEKYHCKVPDEFVEHMRLREWRPPTEDELKPD
jgi:hypothetical protein